jgi:RHS repeat-associated protein
VSTSYPNKLYSTDGTKKTKHIYAGDRLVATIETAGSVVTPYYVHTDQLGSTNAVSDGTGALAQTLDYYPFGGQRISSGTYNEQRQYIGQVYDVDTRLDYLNARYYRSGLGRFISEDSVHLALGNPAQVASITGQDMQGYLADPQCLNSYSYGKNNPLEFSDWTGNSSYDALLDSARHSFAFGQIVTWFDVSIGANIIGHPLTGALMRHSLFSNPGPITITSQNQGAWGNVIDQIEQASEFKASVNKYLTRDGGSGRINQTYDKDSYLAGPIEFKSGDLKTGIHGTSAVWLQGQQNQDGSWINVRITDEYDYKHQSYQSGSGRVLTILNNAANFSQEQGAIRNYAITIEFNIPHYTHEK